MYTLASNLGANVYIILLYTLTTTYTFFPVPPEIIDAESSTSTVNIRENYNASLICKATGTPEPEITWKREDGRKIVIKRKKNNGKKGN